MHNNYDRPHLSDDISGIVFLVWPPLLSETLPLSFGDWSFSSDDAGVFDFTTNSLGTA